MDSAILPDGLKHRAKANGVIPTVWQLFEVVPATDWTHFWNDKKLSICFSVSVQPKLYRILGERYPLLKFATERAVCMGNRDLAVVAIEWSEMKLAGSVYEVGSHQESFGIDVVCKVLNNSEMREIPSNWK